MPKPKPDPNEDLPEDIPGISLYEKESREAESILAKQRTLKRKKLALSKSNKKVPARKK
jgi:hypothetical protein